MFKTSRIGPQASDFRHGLFFGFFGFVATMMPGYSVSANCDTSILRPPDNKGGAIYLTQASDGTYPRKGYLEIGSVLYTEETVDIRERDGHRKFSYVRFKAANGTSGLVRKDSVKSLRELVEAENITGKNLITCDEIKAIIVPVSPSKNVEIYRTKVSENHDAETLPFSRSKFKLVVVKSTTPEEASDGTQYYPVAFAEEEAESYRTIRKDGYVRKADEDQPSDPGTFRIAHIPAENSDVREPFMETTGCGTLIGCFSHYFELLFSDKPNKVAELTEKECGYEMNFSANLNAGVDIGKLPLQFSGSVSGEWKLTLPHDKEYAFKTYKNIFLNPDQTQLLLVHSCKDSGPDQVNSLLIGKKISISAKNILRHLGECIVPASDVGLSGYPEKVFVVPYGLKNGDKDFDYFSVFSNLRKVIEGDIGRIGDLSEFDRQRLIAFILDTMWLWQGPKGSPVKLPPDCKEST